MQNNICEEQFKKQFGKRIRKLRKTKKLTQEQLAECIDIDTQHLCKTENGMHFPSVKNILKIAQGLEVNPVDLFQFDCDEKNEILNKIIYNISNKLNVNELKFVNNTINSLIEMNSKKHS